MATASVGDGTSRTRRRRNRLMWPAEPQSFNRDVARKTNERRFDDESHRRHDTTRVLASLFSLQLASSFASQIVCTVHKLATVRNCAHLRQSDVSAASVLSILPLPRCVARLTHLSWPRPRRLKQRQAHTNARFLPLSTRLSMARARPLILVSVERRAPSAFLPRARARTRVRICTPRKKK